MVRTKADGSTRVAAGGKAPKKTASRPVSMSSPGSNEKGGKDHLPVNRACPRETPAWQKKITFFYDKNAMSNNSMEDSGESSNGKSKDASELEKNDAMTDSSAQINDGDQDVMEEGNSSVVGCSKADESMEMDE